MSAAGRIVNDANELRDDAYIAGEDAGEEAAGRRAEEIDRILRRIEDATGALYGVIAERGARSVEAVEVAVEENPWLSVATAFFAGALVTFLLSRR
jgi:ElaB/YqjD/DUF883 family membrane-anchored ribosome-binding protein